MKINAKFVNSVSKIKPDIFNQQDIISQMIENVQQFQEKPHRIFGPAIFTVQLMNVLPVILTPTIEMDFVDQPQTKSRIAL